jgi:DNA processing protein
MEHMSDPRHERAAVVALLRAGAMSWPQVAADVLEAGSALAVLREPAGQGALFDDSVDRLDAALAEIEAWEAAGIGVHTILDESYPPYLRDIRESPPILFSRGTMPPIRGPSP